MDKKQRLTINDLSGGRNGFMPAHAIKDTECADAVNVDYYKSKFGNKRSGMSNPSFTSGFTGKASSLARHVPATDETAAELWGTDDSATPEVKRLAAGTAWSAPTLKDAPTGNGWDFTYASINGKHFLAYKSAQNRLHCWDASTVRRAGLATPAAPTVANQTSSTTLAVDATASLNYAAGTSFSHTCAANATLLFVFSRADSAAITGVTYNSVAMTQIATVSGFGGNYYIHYLASPASGANTVALTSASSVGAISVSYVGTATTSLPDASTTNTSAGGTLATTITTVADRCWAVYGVADRSGGNPTASANCTSRATASAGTSMTLFDTNGVITPAGAYTMTAVTSGNCGGIAASFPGSGSALSAVQRFVRVRWTVQSAGVTIRRSEPSASTSFTPSGAHAAARITQPTVANEGETHWEIEQSTDDVTFYRTATVAIGTTTYDDTLATTSFPDYPLSDLTGTYQVQKSYKFIAADNNRLLGFGSWTSTDKQNRIEISAIIGSADVGDEERVDTSEVNSYIDLEENDSGFATGLCGPVLGSFFAFKDRQVCQLTPTGSTDAPYSQEFISKSIGALTHYAITRAEDQIGNAAIYFMSHRGPYRWSIAGLEYIGRGVEDYVNGPNGTINLAATKVVARTLYYPDKRQVWFWWATGSSNDPNQGFIFDIVSGGWSRVPSTDLWANVRCACLFANTPGASMSKDLKPYVGQVGGNNRVYKADTGTDDAGTTFKAYIDTKAYDVGGEGFHGELGDSVLLAKAASGVMITDAILADFDTTPIATGTADLTPTTSTQTRVSVPIFDSAVNGVTHVQHRIGDAAPIANAWTLDRLIMPAKKHQAVSA